MRVVVGLGSSLGDRLTTMRLAVQILDRAGFSVVGRSRVYASPPLGGVARGVFYNGAVLLVSPVTDLLALLSDLQRIEARLGRRPLHVRWGDRPIDLDVLIATDRIRTERLVVPHPELRSRPFALVPAAEVAPDLLDPETGETLRVTAARCAHHLVPVAVL